VRRPGGYASVVNGGGTQVKIDRLSCEEIPKYADLWECDTFTCFHCNRVIHVLPKMDPANLGGLCKICMKLICPWCLGKGCTPWEKKMEMAEARSRLLASMGL
jgi:hypothetical protein